MRTKKRNPVKKLEESAIREKLTLIGHESQKNAMCMVNGKTAESSNRTQKILGFPKRLFFLGKYYICSDFNTLLKNIGTKIMEAAIVQC